MSIMEYEVNGAIFEKSVFYSLKKLPVILVVWNTIPSWGEGSCITMEQGYNTNDYIVIAENPSEEYIMRFYAALRAPLDVFCADVRNPDNTTDFSKLTRSSLFGVIIEAHKGLNMIIDTQLKIW
ncbi:MAG: hypothetical protein R8L53_05640 [Mariprofundales bacterium]